MNNRFSSITNHAVWTVICFCLFFFQGAGAAETEPDKTEFFILGLACAPEYQGSDNYSIVPMLVSQFDIYGIDFEIEGLTAQSALFTKGNWKSGVGVELDMGRDDDVKNTAVATMETIEIAFNAGAFLAYGYQDLYLNDDNLEVKFSAYKDVAGTHDGAYATLGLSYALPINIPWRFEFELETTYADTNYMGTYFGVNNADAFSSGLPVYDPDNSFRDISFTVNTLFFFSPQWGLFSRLSAGRLLGDAADSPISKQGSAYQFFTGLGLFYRF